MSINHDLLTRIDERVDAILNMLREANIPGRCSTHSAKLTILQWAVGILATAVLALVGFGIKLLAK